MLADILSEPPAEARTAPMGRRIAPPPSFAARPLTAREAVARRLSDRVVAAARPLRLLDAVNWSPAVERRFLAAGGRDLPAVTADDYRPLPFRPADVITELHAIEADARDRLGDDPLGRLIVSAAREHRAVARLIDARGTAAFAPLSRELFGTTLRSPWVGELSFFLTEYLEQQLDRRPADPPRCVSAAAMADELGRRLAGYFGPARPVPVRVAADVAADCAACCGGLKVRADAVFSADDIPLLEAHEGWAHVGTTLNADDQPVLTLLARCTPSATRTQEGLAVFLEFLTGAAHPRRVRKLLLRLRGLAMAEAGADFRDVYRHFLAATDSPADSYRLAMRLFRGTPPAGGGAFTKDLTYGRGLLDVYRLARRSGAAAVGLLFAGKTSLSDLGVLEALADAGALVRPRFVPAAVRDRRALAAALDELPGLHPLAAVA
jgi:uncharacterized protein (TIGR02421 family)